jgi:hypothetical protein
MDYCGIPVKCHVNRQTMDLRHGKNTTVKSTPFNILSHPLHQDTYWIIPNPSDKLMKSF